MKQALNTLTSNRVIAAVFLGVLSLPWLLLARVTGSALMWLVVALYAAAIAGILLRYKWGRLLGVGLFCFVVVNATKLILTNGWTMQRTCMAVGGGFMAWGLWKKPEGAFFDSDDDDAATNSGEDGPESLMSLVLLRTHPRYLEPLILAQALSDAWDLNIRAHTETEPPEDADDGSDGFVADAGEDAPVFLVFVFKPSKAFFVIHNREERYFNDADTLAGKVPNLRFAEVIRDHRAWLSVDLLEKSSSPETLQQAYQMIGKAISALADDSTLALFCPQHSHFNLWSESLERQLCGPDPLSAFREEVKAPIFGVKGDSGMDDAIAEAQRRWPEFVEAFRRRGPDSPPFIVKAPFATGDNTEHMWLEVFALEPEYVHGHLANDPFYHEKLKKGSQVEVPVTDVSDWVFAENGSPVGNFTGKVVARAQRGESLRERGHQSQ